MNRYWSGVVAASVMAATVALGAQNQNPANTPPPDAGAQPGVQRSPASPSAQTKTPNTITVTGCLQNNPAGTASADARGATGARQGGNAGAGAAEGAGRATEAGRDANAGATGRAGQAAGAQAGNLGTARSQFILNNATMAAGGDSRGAAVGTTGAATSYQLEGEASQLSPHLNHRIEIVGTLQTSSASATGAANAAPGSTAAAPTLRVQSVKMISTDCGPAAGAPRTPPSTQPPTNQTPGNNPPSPAVPPKQ